MKKPFLFAVLILPLASEATPRLGYFTFGPMVHFNFSNNSFKAASFGLEVACWSYEASTDESSFFNNVPDFESGGYGIALGMESDRDAIRMYAEAQRGWVIAGLSLGPVVEFPDDRGPARFGIQGSAWANALAGLDLRYRRIDGKNNQSLGLYAKLPILISGKDDTLSE